MRKWEALGRAEFLAAAPRAVANAARGGAGARADLLVGLGRSPHLAELEDTAVRSGGSGDFGRQLERRD